MKFITNLFGGKHRIPYAGLFCPFGAFLLTHRQRYARLRLRKLSPSGYIAIFKTKQSTKISCKQSILPFQGAIGILFFVVGNSMFPSK